MMRALLSNRPPVVDSGLAGEVVDLSGQNFASIPVAFLAKAPILWHLLSLDAPTVAVTWTIFLTRVTHISLPRSTEIAMGLGVWLIYATDRLFDTSHLGALGKDDVFDELEARHLFHHQYRGVFEVAIAIVTVLLTFFVLRMSHAVRGLYLVEAGLLAAYFLAVHAGSTGVRRAVPKEALVGVFFAAATFIPTLAVESSRTGMLTLMAALFSALCTVNCLYIYAWEHPRTRHPNGPTRFGIRLLVPGTIALIALSLAMALFSARTGAMAIYPVACALSALGLLLLHRFHDRMSCLGLRAAADAVLLTPLLFLAIL